MTNQAYGKLPPFLQSQGCETLESSAHLLERIGPAIMHMRAQVSEKLEELKKAGPKDCLDAAGATRIGLA